MCHGGENHNTENHRKAVSVAKSAGGDIFDVKNQVGHSDIRTTINTYGHIFEEDSLELAQKMDVALKNVH